MSSNRWLRVPDRAIASLLFAFLLISVGRLHSQSFDATVPRQPADVKGVWLVHAGDDPAYASPAFDDSRWTPFDVGKSLHTLFSNAQPPIIWYRLRVKVNPTQLDLALLEHQISSAFEVYVNGRLLVHAGSVAPFFPHAYTARLLAPVPAEDIRLGTLVIAIRVHISPYEWGSTGPGYTASNLFIGPEAALREHIWLVVIGENAVTWVVLFAGMALGIVALALFSNQPGQREYLWVFLQFFTGMLALPISSYELFHTVPVIWDQAKLLFIFGSNFFAILMYFSIIRVRIAGWMRVFFILSFVGVIFFFWASTEGLVTANVAQLTLIPLAVFAYGIMPVLLLRNWRRGNAEAGILLVPLLLTGLAIYIQIALFIFVQIPATAALAFRVARFFAVWQVGPFTVSTFSICSFLFILSLAIIIVLRATRISRQQALFESEMAAAREVQQVILPEATESVPGFQIESVYEPAQQVGGDFYQVLPTRDGGLLLVIGDVAGKGLPAAMLVSVLVGATRTVAQFTQDPAEILANLNERLVGRAGSGFSTALVARFYRHGSVTVANAGHLPPYLDGTELETPGALPLGVTAGTSYKTAEFHLPPGSCLTFISDGVIEAQDSKGELFGFQRSQELSTQPAQAIVAAARSFGQKDDITVVTVRRVAAPNATPEAVAGIAVVEPAS